MPLHKLRIETPDQATAAQVAERLGVPPAPEALAVTAVRAGAADLGGGGLL